MQGGSLSRPVFILPLTPVIYISFAIGYDILAGLASGVLTSNASTLTYAQQSILLEAMHLETAWLISKLENTINPRLHPLYRHMACTPDVLSAEGPPLFHLGNTPGLICPTLPFFLGSDS